MLTREEAWNLLREYNKEPFHLRHALTVEGIMRYFAKELGYADEVEYWGIVGLLHDLDFEQYPEQHCVKSQELMRQHGVDESIIRATASHGWGLSEANIKPEHQMEKVLFAIDELSGLIGAAALMRPTGISDMEPKSVMKKFKDKKFAAGCSRDVIRQGAEMMGVELSELIAMTLDAMRA